MTENTNDINTPVSIELVKPIQISGIEVKVLHMRRPTVLNVIAMRKHSEASKLTGEEQDLFMFAALCDVTPQDLRDLDLSDYYALCDAYQNFQQRPQKNV